MCLKEFRNPSNYSQNNASSSLQKDQKQVWTCPLNYLRKIEPLLFRILSETRITTFRNISMGKVQLKVDLFYRQFWYTQVWEQSRGVYFCSCYGIERHYYFLTRQFQHLRSMFITLTAFELLQLCQLVCSLSISQF